MDEVYPQLPHFGLDEGHCRLHTATSWVMIEDCNSRNLNEVTRTLRRKEKARKPGFFISQIAI
jgi:hypothetical protein